MQDEVKLSWSKIEYEEKDRSADWYWALGVIAITSAAASIIFNNYFFAVLILLAGGLLYYFAKKPPEMIEFQITEKGVYARGHFYPYKTMKSFFVQKEDKPMLYIKTDRQFLPIVNIPLEYQMIDQVHALLLSKKVTEEEMKEHPAEKIMETLGF